MNSPHYVGIDLHSDRFTCHFMSSNQKKKTASFYLTQEQLDDFVSQVPRDSHIAFEASTPSFSFSDELSKRGYENIYILDPQKLNIIFNTSKKTDKIDAEKIAKLLQYHIETDRNFLSIVYKPTKPIRVLRSLFTTYDLIRKEMTQLKNRLHSILKQNLIFYSRHSLFTNKIRKKLGALKLSPDVNLQINFLYNTVASLRIDKKMIQKEIYKTAKPYKETINRLLQIRGIGLFIAIGLIADIGDINRFKNAKHLVSYLRAAPRVDSSNKTTHIKSISKRSRKLSSHLLIQAITHLIKSNPSLGSFYNRKISNKSSGKVKMAVIRKIIVAIYFMLKKNEDYKYIDKSLWEKKKAQYETFLKKQQM